MLTLAWGIDIFEKLTTEIGGWRGEFHANPVFFFNILCGDLHFDALITGVREISYLLVRLLEKVQ